MRVQATRPRPRLEVTADGDGIVGHAGVGLLSELADRLGLTRALAWRAVVARRRGTATTRARCCGTWR